MDNNINIVVLVECTNQIRPNANRKMRKKMARKQTASLLSSVESFAGYRATVLVSPAPPVCKGRFTLKKVKQ